MKNVLDSLIHSLNLVEVKGKENLDILLGCIQTLEKMRELVKTETSEIKIGGDESNDHHNEQRENG